MAVKKKTTKKKEIWWANCEDGRVHTGPYASEAEAQEGAMDYDDGYEWVISKATSTNVVPKNAKWVKI